MRVKHIKPPNGSSDSWLQEGHIYTVLEISADTMGIYYRILAQDDSGTPALHAAHFFTVEDYHIPPSWIVAITTRRDGKTHLQLAPAPWTQANFWERFFDLDDEARSMFDQECHKMLMEY